MSATHMSPMLIWMGAIFCVTCLLALVVWRGRSLSAKPTQVDPEAQERARAIKFDAMQSGAQRSRRPLHQDVIMLHILADEDRPYQGYGLLQAMLTAGLRYGQHKIFHRHLLPNGQGRVLFSAASIQKPGTFEMDAMGGYECPGLSLFFSVQDSVNPMKAYQSMALAAKQLIDSLGGVLRTADHELLTEALYQEQITWLRQHAAVE